MMGLDSGLATSAIEGFKSFVAEISNHEVSIV